MIVDIFHKNRKANGTRKIKTKLQEQGFIVSRRRIGRIMREQGLVSTYTPLPILSRTKRPVMRRKRRMC
ncbi:IS3 family transposase [Bacillus velezensis]|nr:IS3 family transposase [Bacillus velezensis]